MIGCEDGAVHICPLCGTRWAVPQEGAREEAACDACPLSKGCGLRSCPNCGYTLPPESRLIGWLRRLWPGGEDRDA